MAVPIFDSMPESSIIDEIHTKLLEQQKVNSLLLHEKETAVKERNLLREEVYFLYRNKSQDVQTSYPPTPPSQPPPPMPTVSNVALSKYHASDDTINVEELVENLRQAEGGEKIKEQGDKLVSHLRERAKERKRTILLAEDEKERALVELQSVETQMKGRESTFKKEIENLCQENEDILEELDTMKLVYTLKKGMSREDEIRSGYEAQLNSMEKTLEERDSQMLELHNEVQLLSRALNKSQGERNMMLEKYHKLEDRYKQERGYTMVSRTSSFSQPSHVHQVDSYSHERSSSISSRSSQRTLPFTNN
ncbi:hypothetical protein LOD99_6453 [Oopsacas minuta]|uniref:Uncharacterized protein n=1 Tax=Oopsacas minuta TaxID=111878 RepID=A0AAV7JM80_9METZ|nr:hypothetical protein LOD99_6453 [Oopsacas minuta]